MSTPESYTHRNIRLEMLGFSSYRKYVESDLWKLVRRHVWKRDLGVCQVKNCSKRRQRCIHHLKYDIRTLLGITPQYLVTLCGFHHRRCEFNKDGNKIFDCHKVALRTVEKIGYKTLERFGRVYRRLENTAIQRMIATNIERSFPRYSFSEHEIDQMEDKAMVLVLRSKV